jgi:hypothetical protein
MKSAGNLNDQPAAFRRTALNRSRSDIAAAASSSHSHHHQQHQQHRHNRRLNNTHTRPWLTCRWFGPTRKRMKEWGSQLRQFLVGELPASLSLRTKIRIVLEVRVCVCMCVV